MPDYQNFIGSYNDVYPDGFCNHIISEFERISQKGWCGNRQDTENAPKTKKDDQFYFLNLKNHVLSPFNGECATEIFFEGLQRCYDHYVSEYDILKDLNLRCTSVKIQKTSPGGGYHIWHSEQGNGDSANRVLTYILYLNTLDEDSAGETEFLYQRLRIPPQENCMVLWPAAFTHPHRGNAVYGDKPKYIVTGWFYLD